eukprot:4935494-Pleurochrysis_carterae.AAC.7
MHYFDEGDARLRRKGQVNGKAERRDVGYFHTLPVAEQNDAVLAAIEMRAAVRVEAHADLAEQHEYFALKREQVPQRQLEKLTAEYVKAMAAYLKYKARAAPTIAGARAQMAREGSSPKQHTYLREQMELCVPRLGRARDLVVDGRQAALKRRAA